MVVSSWEEKCLRSWDGGALPKILNNYSPGSLAEMTSYVIAVQRKIKHLIAQILVSWVFFKVHLKSLEGKDVERLHFY